MRTKITIVIAVILVIGFVVAFASSRQADAPVVAGNAASSTPDATFVPSATPTAPVVNSNNDDDEDEDGYDNDAPRSVSPTSPTPTPVSPTPTQTQTPPPTQTSQPKSYTLAQVSQHANVSSCWTAVNGKVYDVTTWISQHPGGQDAILGTCGKDASTAFNIQHGGQSQPEKTLASFQIGVLAP